MSKKLDNYLRAYRKRSGLSQEDVAFLLGCRTGSRVSRHELLRRQPTLRAAFAYLALFGVPALELFAGTYDEIHQGLLGRVAALIRKLERGPLDRTTARRIAFLRSLLDRDST